MEETKSSKLENNISDIPDEYFINDYRKITDFKRQTFNGYQKTTVITALQKSIQDGKLEEACHWCVEMLVSGYIMECWDKLILLNSKIINQINPNFPFYLWNRFSQIIQLLEDPRYQGIKYLDLRNNQECRNHLTDIVSIMTLSPRNKQLVLPKISTEDFRLDVFEDKLEGKSIFLIEKIIKPNDPSEINVVMNEFAFQITSRTGNLTKALYWLNWILEWEKINIKSAEGFKCAPRNRKYINPKYYYDIVWIIWDVIFQEAQVRNNETLHKQLMGLFKLFKYNFTSAGKRRKASLLIHSLQLLHYEDKINWLTPIYFQTKLIVQANSNTNLLYVEYKNKCLTDMSYKKKEDGLQILTRNNYLVSDQKIASTPTKQNKNKNLNTKSSDDIANRLNKLNMLDKMIIQKNTVAPPIQYNTNLNIPIGLSFGLNSQQQQNQNQQMIPRNPFQLPARPFYNTEQTLNHIQSFIQ